MITLLVLGLSPENASSSVVRHPSLEILTASGAEDALEKLARNRRIDAVLLLLGAPAAELAATLAEEDPAAPPLFAPTSMGAIPGIRALPADEPDALLKLVVEALEPI